MPSREFEIEDGKKITVVKSKRSKNLRISVSADGLVRVSIPSWLPYRHGLEFAKSKRSWIENNTTKKTHLAHDGQIGKAHRLLFVRQSNGQLTSRITNNQIVIKVPSGIAFTDPEVQLVAKKACIRALKKEANTLLPIRLNQFAIKHGFEYKSVRVKYLKGRWGSCSNSKDITLNCLLMQLTWHEIDYVILHELVHTRNMSHNKEFWTELGMLVRDIKNVKTLIKSRRPILQSN